MIKRLLSNFFRTFNFEHDINKIEQYLSKSSNTYELEQRIHELDHEGKYSKFYI